MSWVLRRPVRQVHTCDRPMREVIYKFPREEHREIMPDGQIGDLWRCADCQRLWCIRPGCDICNRYGPHPGPCGMVRRHAWMPARAWQKVIHLRHGRAARPPQDRNEEIA